MMRVPRLPRLLQVGWAACALAALPAWGAAEVQIVDYGDVAALRVHARQGQKVQYDLISQPTYALRLTIRSPGSVKPAVRHNSAVFRLVLRGGEVKNSAASGGRAQKLRAGEIRYMTDLDGLHPSNTLISSEPFEELEAYVPPIDDDTVADREADAQERSRKRPPKRGRRVDAEHPVGNVRLALEMAPLGDKAFARLPLIKRSEQKGGFYAALLVLRRPKTFKGSLNKELVLIPVEGQARVESGGPLGTIGERSVLRLSVRDLRSITLTPIGGRFAAVALLVGS